MDSNGALALEQETQHVKLGQDIYEIVPQPMPYLNNRLGPLFSQLADVDVEEAGIGEFFMQNSHRVLSVFIPDLMALHTWEGYRDEDERKTGNMDEAYMRRVAPNGPQIKLAFQACLKVNGLDLVTQLGKLVDPSVLRSLVTKWLIKAAEGTLSPGRSLPTTSSASTPASPSETSSTPSSPTGPSIAEPAASA